jgi:hypothetical protein
MILMIPSQRPRESPFSPAWSSAAAWARERALALLLCLCLAAYLAALGAYYVGYFNDDAFYIIGARSLLQGRFAELNAPGAPPLGAYLPGYPLLLSPWIGLFPWTFLPCQLFSIAMVLLALQQSWELFSDDAPPGIRSAALILAGLNPLTVSLSGTVLSDPAYLCAGVLIFRSIKKRWDSESPSDWMPVAGLCAGAAYLRPTGAVFLIALCAALALQKRPRTAALCAAVGTLLILPWLLRNLALRGYAVSYLAEFPRDPAQIAAGALSSSRFFLEGLYARTFLRCSSFGHGIPLLVSIAGLALTLLGWSRTRLRAFSGAYAGLYFAVLTAWGKPSERYLLPLLPFAAVWLLLGVRCVAQSLRRSPAFAVLLIIAAAAVLDFPVIAGVVRDARAQDTARTRPSRAYDWIRAHTGTEEVFAAESDARLHLLTGRRCIRLPREGSPRLLFDALRSRGVRWVLLLPTGDSLMRDPEDPNAPADPHRIRALLQSSPRTEIVFEDSAEGAVILRLPPSPSF